MSHATIEARFLDGVRGKVFVVLRKPTGRVGGPCVLFVPPFAEELNKSRRMFTEVALALAQRGIASLFPDFHGTGDSQGEFREADWDVWKQDLVTAASWAASGGWSVRSVLALRLGCAIAAEVAALLPGSLQCSAFWQPVVEGERFMTQFLRLRVAASMMADQKETVADLRRRVQSGECVEVAGYEVPPTLLAQIDRVKLGEFLSDRLGELHWMEVVRDAASPMSPATQKFLESARPRVRTLKEHAVAGEPFWAATEIVVLPELVARTADSLSALS